MSKTDLVLISLFLLILSLINLDTAFAKNNEESLDQKTIVIWKDVTIPERLEYDTVVVMSGKVDFLGATDKLVVLGGSIHLRDKAVVRSKMIVLGGSVEQSPGAQIPEAESAPSVGLVESWKHKIEEWKNKFSESKDAEENNDDAESSNDDSEVFGGLKKSFLMPFAFLFSIAGFAVLFLLAMLYLAVAPGMARGAEDSLRDEPFISVVWGALAYIIFIPGLIVLALTIIGIPLVPFVAIFGCLIFLAGVFAISTTLGALLLLPFKMESRMIQTLVGLLVLWSLSALPYAGGFLSFMLCVSGTGAVLRSLFGGRRFIRVRYGNSGPTTYDI